VAAALAYLAHYFASTPKAAPGDAALAARFLARARIAYAYAVDMWELTDSGTDGVFKSTCTLATNEFGATTPYNCTGDPAAPGAGDTDCACKDKYMYAPVCASNHGQSCRRFVVACPLRVS
jgi:hypothetical protein